MEWQCDKGHIWKTGYNNIQRGDCQKYSKSKGGKCLTEKYTTIADKYN